MKSATSASPTRAFPRERHFHGAGARVRVGKPRVRAIRTRVCITNIHPIRALSAARRPPHQLGDAAIWTELAPYLASLAHLPDQRRSPLRRQEARLGRPDALQVRCPAHLREPLEPGVDPVAHELRLEAPPRPRLASATRPASYGSRPTTPAPSRTVTFQCSTATGDHRSAARSRWPRTDPDANCIRLASPASRIDRVVIDACQM